MKTCSSTMLVALLLLGGLMATGASAATVTYSPAQWITTDNEVVTTGSLVQALTPSSGNPMINGVPFTTHSESIQQFPIGNRDTGIEGVGTWGTPTSPAGLSTAYSTMLASAFIQSRAGTLPLLNLSIGQTYLIQMWGNFCVPSYAGYFQTYDGNTVIDNSEGGTGAGQYIIGTFTADAPSQVIALAAPTSGGVENGTVFVAAYQLRAIPEPSTLALLACGLVGLVAYAWRKRK